MHNSRLIGVSTPASTKHNQINPPFDGDGQHTTSVLAVVCRKLQVIELGVICIINKCRPIPSPVCRYFCLYIETVLSSSCNFNYKRFKVVVDLFVIKRVYSQKLCYSTISSMSACRKVKLIF